MKKKNVLVKKEVAFLDKIRAINFIADSYFTENDETGQVLYTPYFVDRAKILTFFTYYVEGVLFEEDNDIYNSIVNDEELVDIYHKNQDTLEEIVSIVQDMVDFKKQRMIHQTSLESLFQTLDTMLTDMKGSMDMSEFGKTMQQFMDKNKNSEHVLVKPQMKAVK